MTFEQFTLGIGIIGSVASIVSIFVAVVQTIRYREANRLLDELKRSKNASIWTNITLILQAFDSIETTSKIEPLPTNVERIHVRLEVIRRTVVNCYLNMLRDAVLDEEDFTEETLDKWKRQGKIENQWREQQVRRLIYEHESKPKNDRSRIRKHPGEDKSLLASQRETD